MKASLRIAHNRSLLVIIVWANYAWDRERLPRAWALTAPIDPYDLLRGRFVRLSLVPQSESPLPQGSVALYIKDGLLFARPAACCHSVFGDGANMRLNQSVSFFIPQDIPDPSQLKSGEQLWVEVSLPPKGSPRPLRLAIKSPNGAWRDLSLRPN